MAKYVFNMCRLQLDFYKSHASCESPRSVPFDVFALNFTM